MPLPNLMRVSGPSVREPSAALIDTTGPGRAGLRFYNIDATARRLLPAGRPARSAL